ncbi:hypothetical protein [Streptomyces sp. NPDC090053]|uniref:hypothetical protein n=1 Tax=Streptomyces sp. NPDC090053 TaxID=3365932 RepID=UPI0037F38022
MEIVAEIYAEHAVLEDPFLGEHQTDKLRTRFDDGSWLMLMAEETAGEVHKYLLLHPQVRCWA